MIYNTKLKSLREVSKLKQEDIAKIIEIERGAYSLYESEYVIIPLKHLNTICNYFNVSLDYMFSFSDIKQYKSSNKEIDFTKSGIRLKEFRKEMKLTQDKLAQKLNVARTIISKYEKGEFLIATHTLYDICKKYNISADYLLGKTDEPKYLKTNQNENG